MKLKRIVPWALCLCLLLSLLPVTVFAEEDASEEAEEGAVILISTPEELVSFAESCRLDTWSQGCRVALANDIHLEGTAFDGIPTFGGTFDGAGHRVSGVSIQADMDNWGFFRYLQDGAVVRNLHIQGEITSGGCGAIGGIVGSNAGTVTGCTFTGTVSGVDAVGGICGSNETTGLLEKCRAEGTVHGSHFVGGIAGENHGVIRESRNRAEVNAMASQNTTALEDITFENLLNTESSYTTTDIGGIAGTNQGVIRSCGNYRAVGYPSMGYNVGGIAGSQIGYITDCTNFGSISGRKEVGGIVGQIEPSSVLEYSIDTLQTLRGQLTTLNRLYNTASYHVSSGSDALSGQFSSLQGQGHNAIQAVNTLVELILQGGDADPDSFAAARSDLTDSMFGMVSTVQDMRNSISGTSQQLVNDIKSISGQMSAIGSTMIQAQENLGTTVTDISDQDTEEDTLGKVANCVNYGSVFADRNVGGIAGAMAPENDLDPEDDYTTSGSWSLNLAYESRAVVRGCENQGQVTVKKQGAGGIVGSMTTGAVLDCTNTGTLYAENAREAGGIAGSSSAVIRRSYVKCTIHAGETTGGIAGSGATVTDCVAQVRILGASKAVGGILGNSDSPVTLQEVLTAEERTVSNNHYLVTDTDWGGIGKVSYEGCAEPSSLEDFLAIENLPELFRTVTIRFLCDGKSVAQYSVPLGKRLPQRKIPEVPKRDGHDGKWAGLDDVNLSCLLFDETFPAEYASYAQTIQTAEAGPNGLPAALAEGAFPTGTELLLTEAETGLALTEKETLLASRTAVIDREGAITLHFQADSPDAKNIRVYVRGEDGSFILRDHTADGTYLVFALLAGEETFCVVSVAADHAVIYRVVSGIAAGLLIILIFVILFKKRRRVKTQKK